MEGYSQRPVWVDVDLEKLVSNFREVKKRATEDSLLCPVVKANAYGHGVIPVSKTLLSAGADRLAVALPGEGKELREAGCDCPVHILGEILPSQIPVMMKYDLIPTVAHIKSARELQRAAEKKGIQKIIHIKIDTGMGRIGVLPERALEFILEVNRLSNLVIEGLITHFSCADEKGNDYTRSQWQIFKKIIKRLKDKGLNIPLRHVANSAALINFADSLDFGMVRPGIMLYGLYPSPELKDEANLTPILSWKARIIYLKTVSRGSFISYGATYKTSRETKIATIPLGYADGFSRSFSNQGEVLISGQRAPIVGRVCMDQFMVDVTEIEGVDVGDEVVLIGCQGEEKITADELAEKLDTINYEVICNISDRIPRKYVNN